MNKIEKLQKLMITKGIDFFIVPTSDPHGSEYIPEYYKEREWLTGFTGSAGTALVTQKEGFLWVDGRYFIQAEKEIIGSGFHLMKMSLPGVPNLTEFLKAKAKPNSVIGFNGEVISSKLLQNIKRELTRTRIEFLDENLIESLWANRVEKPSGKIYPLSIEYTKYTAKEKCKKVQEKLRELEADLTVISSLDDIAWLCNLRGNDIESSPVFMSFMVVTRREATLYLPPEKQTKEIISNLTENDIYIKDYYDIYQDAKNTHGSFVYLELEKTNERLYQALEEGNEIITGYNITTELKAIKNDVELKNQKEAYQIDAIALVKYFHWLKEVVKERKVTEFEAQQKLTEFRLQNSEYIEDSFTPISAYGANAAMMHYSASEENSDIIETKGLYLVDSGGQYKKGTTDITRTLAMGKLSDEEKRDYTLVLKSHIQLIRAIFLEGTTGTQLDAIARYPLWQYHLDYKSGTGHGVGYFLNVHEGPHSISKQSAPVPLEKGMIVTIEPGIYKAEKHGIRLENVVAVELNGESDDGTFYGFDVLSYIPFEREAILKEYLSEEELKWLNLYHEQTYEKMKDSLEIAERKWLRKATEEM